MLRQRVVHSQRPLVIHRHRSPRVQDAENQRFGIAAVRYNNTDHNISFLLASLPLSSIRLLYSTCCYSCYVLLPFILMCKRVLVLLSSLIVYLNCIASVFVLYIFVLFSSSFLVCCCSLCCSLWISLVF